jgi:hypothetical protein
MRKKSQERRSQERGQTTVEYLLLIAATFIASYLMITGPVSSFTARMLNTMRAALGNMVQNGDLRSGEVVPAGQSGHPGDPSRHQALHN